MPKGGDTVPGHGNGGLGWRPVSLKRDSVVVRHGDGLRLG